MGGVAGYQTEDLIASLDAEHWRARPKASWDTSCTLLDMMPCSAIGTDEEARREENTHNEERGVEYSLVKAADHTTAFVTLWTEAQDRLDRHQEKVAKELALLERDVVHYGGKIGELDAEFGAAQKKLQVMPQSARGAHEI